MIRRSMPLAAAVVAMLLTACGSPAGGEGFPTPEPPVTATPTATPTPVVTPTPTPTPAPVPEPEPEPPAETPLSARGAYDRCVTLSTQYLYAGRVVNPAGFASADVILRSDGLFYVYVEVTVPDAPTASQRDVAYECVLGGTVEHPRDEWYGGRTRAPRSERDPEMSIVGDD
jgi:hypothetical protein